MLNIWSRTTQIRSSCRCVPCLSATTAVGRRVTTGATRRPLRFGDYVYLFSTGIFASAAVADANVKENRRKRLDDAIDHERRKLEAWQAMRETGSGMSVTQDAVLSESTLQHLAENYQPVYTPLWAAAVLNQRRTPLINFGSHLRVRHVGDDAQDPVTVETVAEPPGLQRNLATETYQSPSEMAEVQNILRGKTSLAEHPNSPQWNMKHFPPQSIYVEETNAVRVKDLWNSRKLRIIELSVAKLVYHLILRLGPSASQELSEMQPFMGVRSRYLLKRELRLVQLRLSHLIVNAEETVEPPLYPQYNQDGYGAFRRETQDLNDSLKTLFQSYRVGNITFTTLIIRICYNLLACESPPNINTYNLMIYSLAKMRDESPLTSSMAQLVINSLREAKIRPNEITLCVIVHHYANTGNVARFSQFIRLMAGRDHGLALAKADVRITAAGAPRLLLGRGKVLQIPTLDRNNFGAIMRGNLKFFGLDAGLQVVRSMHMEGWPANLSILTMLLKGCATLKDWEAGRLVWEQIISLSGTHSPGLSAYREMLHLCFRCGETDRFRILFQEALTLGYTPTYLRTYLIKHVASNTQDEECWLPDLQHLSATEGISRPSGINRHRYANKVKYSTAVHPQDTPDQGRSRPSWRAKAGEAASQQSRIERSEVGNGYLGSQQASATTPSAPHISIAARSTRVLLSTGKGSPELVASNSTERLENSEHLCPCKPLSTQLSAATRWEQNQLPLASHKPLASAADMVFARSYSQFRHTAGELLRAKHSFSVLQAQSTGKELVMVLGSMVRRCHRDLLAIAQEFRAFLWAKHYIYMLQAVKTGQKLVLQIAGAIDEVHQELRTVRRMFHSVQLTFTEKTVQQQSEALRLLNIEEQIAASSLKVAALATSFQNIVRQPGDVERPPHMAGRRKPRSKKESEALPTTRPCNIVNKSILSREQMQVQSEQRKWPPTGARVYQPLVDDPRYRKSPRGLKVPLFNKARFKTSEYLSFISRDWPTSNVEAQPKSEEQVFRFTWHNSPSKAAAHAPRPQSITKPLNDIPVLRKKEFRNRLKIRRPLSSPGGFAPMPSEAATPVKLLRACISSPAPRGAEFLSPAIIVDGSEATQASRNRERKDIETVTNNDMVHKDSCPPIVRTVYAAPPPRLVKAGYKSMSKTPVLEDLRDALKEACGDERAP